MWTRRREYALSSRLLGRKRSGGGSSGSDSRSKPPKEVSMTFNHERNVYICLGGFRARYHRQHRSRAHPLLHCNKNDCSICLLKRKCTRAVARKFTRDIDEDVRDQVRALANTEAFQQSRSERKKVEMRNRNLRKRIGDVDQQAHRGPGGGCGSVCRPSSLMVSARAPRACVSVTKLVNATNALSLDNRL